MVSRKTIGIDARISSSDRHRPLIGQRPRHAVLTFLAPAAIVFTVYCLTLAPTVTGEDSGELISAAYDFGVPHPPGYPLWTILCGIWTHVIPIGNIAWRANLFSAACMAAAVGVTASTLTAMNFHRMVACTAAVVCGLTTAVWSQSVITEVYTLNLLMIAIVMWFMIRWERRREPRDLLWASLAVGLGMCNHHTMGLAALGLAIWALTRDRSLIRNVGLMVRCAAMIALGLLPYAYLLWAARRNMPVNWGETTTPAALWEHFYRGQYKSESTAEAPLPMTLGLFLGRCYYGLRWLTTQFTPILIPLIGTGFVFLWRRRPRRKHLVLVLVMWLCSGIFFHYMEGPRLDRQDEFVHKVFHTPLALVFAIPLAAGLQWLVAATRQLRLRIGTVSSSLVAKGALCAVALTPLVAHWRENNMRHYWYAFDHARNILACLQPDSIIFPSGDHNTFPLIYLIHVEGHRPDVTIADKYGYVELELYQDMPNNPGKPRTMEERDEIEKWIIKTQRRPVYYTIKKTPEIDEAEIIPVGLLYHLLPKGKELDAKSCWASIRYTNLQGVEAPEDLAAMNILADYYYARAITALGNGDNDRARADFKLALDHAWGMKEIHNNVASALADHGLIDEAIVQYEAAALMDWRYVPARWNLAKIFDRIEKYGWAAKVFSDIAAAVPGDYRPRGELGFLFRDHLGSPAEAKRWMYESLRINPIQPQIIGALAELEQGSSHQDYPAASQPTTAPVETNGLQMSKTEIDFGELIEGEKKEKDITLRNAGVKDIKIAKIKPSCTCVTHHLEGQVLSVGQSRILRIGIDTKKRSGSIRETLTLTTDDPDQAEFIVNVRANILSAIEVTPAKIQFSALAGQTPEPVSIQLRHRENKPFVFKSVKADPSEVTADIELDKDSLSHQLKVGLSSPVTRPGRGHVQLETSLADHGHIEIPVEITAESPATIQPSLVYLGLLQRDEKATRQVLIEAREPKAPLAVKIDAGFITSPGLQVELQAASKEQGRWLLKIQFDASSAPPGRHEFTVPIRVADSGMLLEVPVHVIVAD